MSKIEVNQIGPQCGTTLTVGCGAGQTVNIDANTVTLGRCGATVQLAAGASQTGFGRTGTVDWDTTAKTGNFTAVSGVGYFLNTTSGAITVTLPAGSAGAIVSLSDYTNTWQTNNVTVSPNGSDKIGGIGSPASLSTEGQSVTFVYVDGTEGWKNVQDSTSNVTGNPFIQATGGTISYCGDFKIHTFTSPGTFCVSSIAQCSAQNTVGYLVIAGGGSGGGGYGGGGGAGGFREGRNVPIDNFTASPLVANAPTNAVTITATSYPITVGAGGAAGCRNNGSNSVFSTITSAGGGGGRDGNGTSCVGSGGSGGGGGGGGCGVAGSGNTPPVSPPQGNPGGIGTGGTPPGGSSAPNYGRAGGGGAGGTGGNAAPNFGGPGGNGATTSISGSSVTRAGGGGGGIFDGPATAGSGGPGGGGAGSPGTPAGGNGTANTGSGGGGSSHIPSGFSPSNGAGGSGIVIIRYKYQ